MQLLISLATSPKVPSFIQEVDAKTEVEQRRYLIGFWVWANDAYFNKRLQRLPKFVTKKPVELEADPQNPQGMWLPESAHMYIDSQNFIKGWRDVFNVTLHEMCHQAVTEIDRKEEKSVHGPRWVKWMQHCGLPVNKIMWLRNPHMELTETQEKNWDATNTILNSTQSNVIPDRKLKLGTAVRFMDRDHFNLHDEVLVGKTRHEGKLCWVLVGEDDIGTNLVTYHEAAYYLYESHTQPSPALLRYANKIHKYMGLK